MKRIQVLALSIGLSLALTAPALAETVGTVTGGDNIPKVTQNVKASAEQKQAREDFKLNVYLPKMKTIVDLRLQTKNVASANEATRQQIKDAIKNTAKGSKQNVSDQIKTINAKNKDLYSQIKTLSAKKADLWKQINTAIKNNDQASIATLKEEYAAIQPQIEDLNKQIQANKDSVSPLKDELKADKTTIETLKAQIKPINDQIKALDVTIKSEEAAKKQVWIDYANAVKSSDFTTAGNDLDTIIAAKQQIIKDLEQKGTLLSQLLEAIKVPSPITVQ